MSHLESASGGGFNLRVSPKETPVDAKAERLRSEIRRYVEGQIHVEDLESWLMQAEHGREAPSPDFDALVFRVEAALTQHWVHPESMPDEKLRQHLATLLHETRP